MNEILIYQTEDGITKIQVQLTDNTVWLTQADMTELFQTTKQNISLHIKNIFEEGELVENSVVKEYLTTAADGKNYRTRYYNLDVRWDIHACKHAEHPKKSAAHSMTYKKNHYLWK